VRGWFQPPSQLPATDAGGSRGDANHAYADIGSWQAEAAARRASSDTPQGEDNGADAGAHTDSSPAEVDEGARAVPAGTSEPQADAGAQHVHVNAPPAETSEPPTAVQASLAAAADPQTEAGETGEPPTAVQVPAARPSGPKFPPGDRPADITRPQLILDDTVVDIGGLRGGWNLRQADATSSSPPAGSPPAGSPGADAADGTRSSSAGSRTPDAPMANGSGASAGTSSPPADKPSANDKPSGKRSRSVFGPEPAARPDMLTDAETVVMPSLKAPAGQDADQSAGADDAAAKSRNAAAVRQQAITAMVPVGTSAAFAEAVTQVLPTVEPSELPAGADAAPARNPRIKRDRPPAQPPRRYTPRRRTTMISRLVLLAILSLQAVLSLRLHNTAFEDESLYLYAGHMELQHLLHGTALQGAYASYFSGSPVLYPVAAAALDQLGGLAAARALSLFEMLATTVLLYSLTRRLFNERIGLCAAAFFAVTESVIFLGNFATYDATCLSLLALAAWIMVRTAGLRWPVFLLAALPAALAVGVKYAGLLFVPTIAVLPVLAGWPERGRRVLWYPAAFGVAVAGLLFAALRLGGKSYMTAISSTTTNRAQGLTPNTTILREAAEWGGVLFAAAVIGTIAYVWRVRTEPDEKIAPSGGRFRRTALGVVLTGTALLAPAYQAHLHTDISFLKHIGFGLFFAAPMAGFGLARVMGDYFRRPQFGIAAWSLALVLGMVQSGYLFHSWPSCQPFVSAFAKHLKPNSRYLVEVPEVPIYYLMGRQDAQPKQFTSTFYILYKNKKGQILTGPAGFTAAVQDGYFQVIAFSNTVTLAADGSLEKALKASRAYYQAADVHLTDSFGPVDYHIWVKRASSPARGTAAKKSRG
jgi:hypothetical protein